MCKLGYTFSILCTSYEVKKKLYQRYPFPVFKFEMALDNCCTASIDAKTKIYSISKAYFKVKYTVSNEK